MASGIDGGVKPKSGVPMVSGIDGVVENPSQWVPMVVVLMGVAETQARGAHG